MKNVSPEHWPSLLQTGEGARPKPNNMIIWWDLVEKFESELETHDKKALKEK